MTPTPSPSKLCTRTVYGVLMCLSFQMQVHAADIANLPLATQSAGAARSNLMFIMDDSISMGWDYLPDSANYGNLCEGYHVLNKLFYNPSTIYAPPPNADGTPMANATWPNAKKDGYSSSNNSNDFSDLSVLANLSPTTTRTSAAANNNTSKYYYALYNSTNPVTPVCSGSNYDWTRWTIVTSLPVAQQTNYANWYSYYRTRMLSMRGAVGTVMQEMDATRFRVGYSAISDDQYSNGSGFLRLSEFNLGTQKADFYSRLYAAPTTGFTPLRPALEKIGKYYAGRQMNGTTALPSGAEPLQYSCQRNYAMLTTDGFWNRSDEPNNYTPTRLGGSTAIGNPDNASGVARPRLDDGRTRGNNWTTGGAGVPNTLADIAMYFFDTDLRTSALGNCTGSIANQDVCANNVGFESPPPNLAIERVQHQRMTTYALGLGVAGTLAYQPNYEAQTSGDFFNIRNGNTPWPDPDVANNGYTVATRADDLWHAAVNGRGRYYSASNKDDLVTQLSDALQNIAAATGSAAAAATSTQRPVTGDNFVYRGLYTTVLWEGNLKAFTIDPSTAAVSTTALWEAKNTLAAQVGATTDTRNIYFRNTAVSGTQRSSFTWANVNAVSTTLGAYFTNVCQTNAFKLGQCASLVAQGASVQTAANDGSNLVNFLRGQRGKEDIATNAALADRLYRGRPNTPLGDIVNSAPVYVKKSPFRYGDAGYNTFVTSNATRQGVVYVAANDGMLHAFNADNGSELWAYVPTAVMENMWRLADNDYDVNHRYFVDATPVVGDVFDGTNWRTILVGGLGAGGRAYYALDITNPTNPISLWEFSKDNDGDLGFTFGNPVITKDKAGTWVVAFSSGYNNINPGNGNGHLYIRNAVTGAAISKVSTFTSGVTPAGTTAAPSELGKINAWVEVDANNVASRFYAGDMLGYMWRFDFDNNIAPTGNEAMLLGRAMAPNGTTPQPITTRPALSKVGNATVLPTVTFVTGRYLGLSDIGDQTVQSVYVIKETLGTSGLGTVRNNLGMVQQTIAATTVNSVASRGVTSPQPVDWSTRSGWFADFALAPAGERANVDPIQTGSLLVVTTNLPSPTACNPGGTSWLYFFDLQSGMLGGPGGNTYLGAAAFTTITAGASFVKKSGGGGSDTVVIRAGTDGATDTVDAPPVVVGGTAARRSSWRELVN